MSKWSREDENLDGFGASAVKVGEGFAREAKENPTMASTGAALTHVLLTAILAELRQARLERRAQA